MCISCSYRYRSGEAKSPRRKDLKIACGIARKQVRKKEKKVRSAVRAEKMSTELYVMGPAQNHSCLELKVLLLVSPGLLNVIIIIYLMLSSLIVILAVFLGRLSAAGERVIVPHEAHHAI